MVVLLILLTQNICLKVLLFVPFCVIKTFNDMKKYKVKDVLQMLKKDGWYLARTKVDHRQFKHPSKPGTVTIRGKESEVLNQFLLNSIWHQAGWK